MYKAASKMADSHNQQKRVTTNDFDLNGFVSVAISCHDFLRLPNKIIIIHGDKARSYTLECKHGIPEGRYRAGDLEVDLSIQYL